MASIYNEGIEDRAATFETAPRTAHAIAALLATGADRYPAVVVEREGRIAGFAWTAEYRPRHAYAGVAEFSVYVARAARGQGVGRLALSALISEAESNGFTKLVSRISGECRWPMGGRRPTRVARNVPHERLRRSIA